MPALTAYRLPLTAYRLPLTALRQNELDGRLDGIVVALENRDSGEGAVLPLGVPAFGVACLALALDRRRAHHGREHVPGAPAPDFLAREILHHEIVGLSAGETQLEHLARVVLDVEREPKLVRVVVRNRYVELGHDWRVAICSVV